MPPSSRITYRTGDSPAASACVRHAGAPVKFQCHGCLDWLCARCLAPRATDVCALCQAAMTRDKSDATRAAAAPSRIGPVLRWAGIGLLVIGAAVAVISVVGSLRPGPVMVSDQAAMDREAVATLVEQNRDAQGLVLESLDAHLAKLPPGVAQRVRSGALRYHVSPDRRSYDITVAPAAAPQ